MPQCTHCQGKRGNVTKKIPVRENPGNSEILPKQGIWFAQVVNSQFLKVKDILIFAAKNSKFSLKLDKSSSRSVLCM